MSDNKHSDQENETSVDSVIPEATNETNSDLNKIVHSSPARDSGHGTDGGLVEDESGQDENKFREHEENDSTGDRLSSIPLNQTDEENEKSLRENDYKICGNLLQMRSKEKKAKITEFCTEIKKASHNLFACGGKCRPGDSKNFFNNSSYLHYTNSPTSESASENTPRKRNPIADIEKKSNNENKHDMIEHWLTYGTMGYLVDSSRGKHWMLTREQCSASVADSAAHGNRGFCRNLCFRMRSGMFRRSTNDQLKTNHQCRYVGCFEWLKTVT